MAKSREKKLEKIEVIEKPSFTSKPHFSFKGIETTAQVILEIKNLEVRILLLITSTNEIWDKKQGKNSNNTDLTE